MIFLKKRHVVLLFLTFESEIIRKKGNDRLSQLHTHAAERGTQMT
jgi:hypothetical protein